jgi:hypothetical protein
MKLVIFVDGGLEIMRVFLFISYNEIFGCYGNKKTSAIANLIQKLDPLITQKSTENIFYKT